MAEPERTTSPASDSAGESDRISSALPSKLARSLAFLAILVGGLCGGLIGFAFIDTQCTGECSTWTGLGAIVGAVSAAAGVAVIAILTLRAMDEWETIRERDSQ